MWGSQGVGWSHLRGPCRRKKPLPLARVEVKIKIKAMKIMIIIMIMMQVNLLFEACMRHETLWQLLVQKGIKYHCIVIIITTINVLVGPVILIIIFIVFSFRFPPAQTSTRPPSPGDDSMLVLMIRRLLWRC